MMSGLVNGMFVFEPPVIAHRGACAYAPENTMVSFTKAVQLGIHWVEFDVMLAACGTPIVFHDETLDRTTNAVGNVGDYTYAYLRTLDAGTWFSPAYSCERIPSFAQVLEFVRDTGLCANVEIKPLPNQDQATVAAVLNVVSRFFPENNSSILFSSFSIPTLRFLRAQAPHCSMGLLMHEWIPDWESIAEELRCVSINVNQEILTPDKPAALKVDGRQLLSYTVNDITRAEQLFSWGVDAVFSDNPDIIARFG